jgi:hypothetical protein
MNSQAAFLKPAEAGCQFSPTCLSRFVPSGADFNLRIIQSAHYPTCAFFARTIFLHFHRNPLCPANEFAGCPTPNLLKQVAFPPPTGFSRFAPPGADFNLRIIRSE